MSHDDFELVLCLQVWAEKECEEVELEMTMTTTTTMMKRRKENRYVTMFGRLPSHYDEK